MITAICPLKTCQAKNDPDACKCWNCGGPMPENAWDRPRVPSHVTGAPEAQRIMAKADPYRENPAPPVIQKTKLKTYSAKDVTIVLKGAGQNGEDVTIRGDEVEDAAFIAPDHYEHIADTCEGRNTDGTYSVRLDAIGEYLYGVKR